MVKDRKIQPKKESLAAKFAAQPGRLARGGQERPLLRRIRPEKSSDLRKLVAGTLDLKKDEFIRLAGVALTTLDILVGKADKQVARTKLRTKRPHEQLEDAHEMVHRLLSFLSAAAPAALTAQIILDDDGRLVAHRKDQAERDKLRHRLHGENQAVLYPSTNLYAPEGVLRLYK